MLDDDPVARERDLYEAFGLNSRMDRFLLGALAVIVVGVALVVTALLTVDWGI